MPLNNSNCSTGLPDLDEIFQGLRDGDNVVWNIDAIDDYKFFVLPFADKAIRSGKKLIYFRFAKHKPLLGKKSSATIIRLNPNHSFEGFISEIHNVIKTSGPASAYVFDCLSDLAVDWSSDRMLGNFFLLTCPYVFGHGGIAYFGLHKNKHSFHAIEPVSETAQILVDVYRYQKKIHIHPLKVQYRYSNQMFMLYALENDRLSPVTESSKVTEVFSSTSWKGLERANYVLGFWSSSFARAELLLEKQKNGEKVEKEIEELTQRLLRMVIARDGKMLDLAKEYICLKDLVNIRRRMIGTGLIGGKSVGLILAQAILRRKNSKLQEILAPHDSFFIGADVFYTYLVQNGLWWIKQKQKNPDSFLEAIELTRYQLLKGHFPDYIISQFANLLDYFGQSPIIIRSSSLLEDDFDNSFAGKAESIILANQGSHNDRMINFISAVQRVYASNMSEDVLKYRASRGLLDRDEQMAILVQRIYGISHDRIFFPHLAGVGLSFNPYAWSDRIDPHAGVLRLVFGLGTRAVGNNGEEHIRLVALNEPELQLQNNAEMRYQQKADVLNLDSGQIYPLIFSEVAQKCPKLPLEIIASKDERLERLARESKLKNIFTYSLTFSKLLKDTCFVNHMRSILKTLEKSYNNPVDIEFAVNILEDGSYKINLIQCRPIQVKKSLTAKVLKEIPSSKCILKSSGPVIGRRREFKIDRIIYVIPEAYSSLPERDRYAIARYIGEIVKDDETQCTMLIGPGRWGTTSPELGIPISFPEIKSVDVICEIAAMHEYLIPDLSLGSHFFNELIETDILYFAIQPNIENHFADYDFLNNTAISSEQTSTDAEKWKNIVRVIYSNKEKNMTYHFVATPQGQKAILYSE